MSNRDKRWEKVRHILGAAGYTCHDDAGMPEDVTFLIQGPRLPPDERAALRRRAVDRSRHRRLRFGNPQVRDYRVLRWFGSRESPPAQKADG